MSTFPGIMSEIPRISVDRFDGKNLLSEVFFLSHFHADHMVGLRCSEFHSVLRKNESAFLYCSAMTASFVSSNHLQGLDNKIKILTMNREHVISVKGLNGCITVTALPAGHCPGSIMFLFNYKGFNYLYTGDFRMTKENILNMKALRDADGELKPIQTLYLDTTFFHPKYSYLPDRDKSMTELIKKCRSWLQKGKDFVIDLRTPAVVGVECVLIKLSNEFQQPVHVSEATYDRFSRIPEIFSAITKDGNSRIHACIRGSLPSGSPVFLKHHTNLKEHNVLSIKLCTLHATNYTEETSLESFKESQQLYRLVYSSHSSHGELLDFIDALQPKKIVPCVVPPKNTMEQVLQALKSTMDQMNKRSRLDESETLQFSSFEDDTDGDSGLVKKNENPKEVVPGEALLTLSKYNVVESSDEEDCLYEESEDEGELPPFRWDCFYDGSKTLGFQKKDGSQFKRRKMDGC